VDQTTSIIEIL